jgi:hypothetical protein
MQHVSAGPFAVANVDPRRKFGSTAKSQLTTMSDFFDATNHIELTDIDEPTCFRPKAFTAPLHRAMLAEIGHQMILEYKLLSVELADCVGRLDESLAATAMLTNTPHTKKPTAINRRSTSNHASVTGSAQSIKAQFWAPTRYRGPSDNALPGRLPNFAHEQSENPNGLLILSAANYAN